MSRKEPPSQTREVSGQSGATAPSAGSQGALQCGALGLPSLDPDREEVVQPFPRSPNLLRRLAKAAQPSPENLAARVQELQAASSKAEAHIKSLKKRKRDLTRSSEGMKQQVREHFEEMQAALRAEERAALDSLELDWRTTSDRLDRVLRGWERHLDQLSRAAAAARRSPSGRGAEADVEADEGSGTESLPQSLRSKRPDASEADIRLNEERFKRLLKTLRSISKELRARLQRKTLLLDTSPVSIDRQTCHRWISVRAEGRGVCFSNAADPAPEHPLQFDRVCCALSAEAVKAGQHYWEVDVRCCSAWAVGVAYGGLKRKGRDKGAKLGRNRSSWCVELRDGQLSAWHNDHGVGRPATGRAAVGKVGVWVNYEKGQLVFYDAETMDVLQRFSAAQTLVFDRAHHQFTEPLYPAVRFLKAPTGPVWSNHMEICDLTAL